MHVTIKFRCVEQVKFPYEVGILVLVDTCIFLDVVREGLSDGFASDKVDELVGQKNKYGIPRLCKCSSL